MVKIRLMRIGAKKRPFYRVVAIDERSKRTGAYLELLGTYNPLTNPHEINLKQDRIDYWVKQGAQMSDGFLRIIGKAPQKPPRKPKKSHSAEEAPRDEEKKAEEKTKETVILESEATPESKEDAGPASQGEQASMTENKPEGESEEKNEGTA